MDELVMLRWFIAVCLSLASWGASAQMLPGIVNGNPPASGPTSVWSAADAATNSMTLTNGGLTVQATTNGYQSIRGTVNHTAGKYYIEFNTPSGKSVGAGNDAVWGIADASFTPTNYLGSSGNSAGTFFNSGGSAETTGFTQNYNIGSGVSITLPANTLFAIAVDLTAGKIWIAQNNVWFGSGNPGTGANPVLSIAAPALGLVYFPALTLQSFGSGSWTLKPTAASQTYAAPAGFAAWN